MLQATVFHNYLALLRTNFKLNTMPNLLLAVLFLCLLPIIQGISNLDDFFAAQCLENFVSILGIILLTPVFLPEQNKGINEIVSSKAMSQLKIIFLRIIMSFIFLVILILLFTQIMQLSNCKFPYFKYVFGTFSSALALGSVGLLFSSVFENTIIGYLASVLYLLVNMFTQNKFLGKFYLSSMTNGSFIEKYWLLGAGVLLIGLALLMKSILKRK